MKDPRDSSFLHKAADVIDDVGAFLFFTSPIWLAAAGVAAGVMLAPVLGVGAIAAGVVGAVAGFGGGLMSYTAMACCDGRPRLPVPANIVLKPIAALGDKVHTMALAQEVPAADKKRLKEAFNKSVVPSPAARRFVNSGKLYQQAALTVRNKQGTFDSVVRDLEAKTYYLQAGAYKP
ncbi:MAG: hypothetical protein ACAH80_13575 [Alphaproteobacteria bacterium]